jgi:hypothetical protein
MVRRGSDTGLHFENSLQWNKSLNLSIFDSVLFESVRGPTLVTVRRDFSAVIHK